MFVSVNVQLEEGETLDQEPDALAAKLLKAIGGDATADRCHVYVAAVPVTGMAGAEPPFEPAAG